MVSGAGIAVEGEERLERVEVDLPAGQRAQLGGERKLAVDRAVVERLDPEAVAREHEPPPARVPDRDGEHPAQALCELVAVLLVEMEHHFGVAVRPEAVPGALQLGAQLAEVVDLAVLDDDGGAVLVRDRLVARLEVDDREPPRGEGDVAVAELPEAVRAAMNQRPAHLCERDPSRRSRSSTRFRRSHTRGVSLERPSNEGLRHPPSG